MEARAVHAKARRLLPERWRDRAAKAGEAAWSRLREVPGSDQVEAAVRDAPPGVADLVSKAALASLRTDAVRRAYERSGSSVASLSDIRSLPLKTVDEVKPRRLELPYLAAGAAQGGAAGFLISGGEAAAIVGAAGGGAAGGLAGGPRHRPTLVLSWRDRG